MTGEDALPPLREVINRFGLMARKGLGQNFLLDLNLTRKIARAGGPLEGRRIIEIGPGPGGLTRALLMEGAREVIAIERDARCLPALDEIARAYPGRLKIVAGDALTLDERSLLPADDPCADIVANLPYNVGTALLIKWLTPPNWRPFWAQATLLFQREVADRLMAAPRTKEYGRLSLLAQFRCDLRRHFDIPPEAFTPRPKVTSSLVGLTPLAAPRFPARLEDLESVAAAAFGQRRKMLRAALRPLTEDVAGLLAAAGLEPTARAEEISLEGFCALARAYAARRAETRSAE